MNMFAIVARLLIIRNANELSDKLWQLLFVNGETARNWDEMLTEEGYLIDEKGNTNMLYKSKIDFNETQMSSVHICCVDCTWEARRAGDTQMTVVEVCDLEGMTGSVTLAYRRLKRARAHNSLITRREATGPLERKCDETVSRRTIGAASYLRDNRRYIVAEGIREQQNIFETQMMRLGEHDGDVEEWRDDFDMWPTFAEQIRSFPRYNRHQRSW